MQCFSFRPKHTALSHIEKEEHKFVLPFFISNTLFKIAISLDELLSIRPQNSSPKKFNTKYAKAYGHTKRNKVKTIC